MSPLEVASGTAIAVWVSTQETDWCGDFDLAESKV